MSYQGECRLTTLLLSMRSIAWLCSTVGLFLAKSSVVSAYVKSANSVPPRRMTCSSEGELSMRLAEAIAARRTVRLPVCVVIRTTMIEGGGQRQTFPCSADYEPLPPIPRSRHFFQSLVRIFDPNPTPIGNGPTLPTYGFPWLDDPVPVNGLPSDAADAADAAAFLAASLASLSRRSCVELESGGSCDERGGWVARGRVRGRAQRVVREVVRSAAV